jgi:hypothetical protein
MSIIITNTKNVQYVIVMVHLIALSFDLLCIRLIVWLSVSRSIVMDDGSHCDRPVEFVPRTHVLE